MFIGKELLRVVERTCAVATSDAGLSGNQWKVHRRIGDAVLGLRDRGFGPRLGLLAACRNSRNPDIRRNEIGY